MELVILYIGLFFNLAIGILVLSSNHKKSENRFVALSSLSLIVWEVSNYLANNSGHLTLFWNRATFIGPIFILLFSELFILYLSGKKASKHFALLFVLSIIVSAFTLSPFLVTGVKEQIQNGVHNGYTPIFGFAFYIIVGWYVYLITRLISRFVVAWRGAKGKLRLQLNIVVTGSFIAVLLALITNLILPIVLNNIYSTEFAPIASVIFMGSLALAIVQHGLFDIRLIVARTLGYIFSLVTLGGMFVIVAHTLTSTILVKSNLDSIRWVYTIIAVLLAATFPYLKRFFDKVTNKIFYRDAYDAQVFLENFNKIVVSTFELNKLLNRVLELIEENLKPSYCLFGLKEDEYTPRSITGTTATPTFSEADIEYVRKITPKMKQKIIISEMLDAQYRDFQKKLQEINVSIIARMTTSVNAEGIGYLVLGPKKSGGSYSSQDFKVLEILANELVVAIQNALHTEEIERFNLMLQARIAEATKRLRQTNEKLRALDEAKDDFVSMASHQLRTPLTSVKGNISLVLDGDTGKISNLQRQMLQQAYGSSQRMVYLIADLLNVSRLKTGKFVIEPSTVNLVTIVEDEIRQLQETAQSHQLTLNFIKETDIPNLMLDETKTRQVIMNFIDNAIYYTPTGGKIDVHLKSTSSSVECRVQDNGIGVPKSEQHHLFTKFYRASNARKARPDGTGLGLFMAKKVIVSEGGTLIFESQEGKGSTFGFSFPKSLISVDKASTPQPPKQTAVVA